MISNLLSIFGLHEKERLIFMKTLELGGQPASQIARLLELPRNTTRDILDKLVNTGLLIRTRHANTHYYSVDTLNNIVRSLEVRKIKVMRKIDEQMEFVKTYGDELQPHKYAPTRPKVTFYEGEDGLRRVYEDTLSSHESIRAFASLHEMYETLPGYFPDYFVRRTRKKISIRAIFPDTPEARERTRHDSVEMRESRLVQGFHWTPEMNMYDDKFMIISWKEKLAIMVQSQEVADAMKALFDMAWGASVVHSDTRKPKELLSAQKQRRPKRLSA